MEKTNKPIKLPKGASSSKEYHFRNSNRVPKAKLIVQNGEYILKKGSNISSTIANNDTVKLSRAKWGNYIKDNKTTKDIAFKSPSGAGAFVYGKTCNGKVSWIDDEGNTLGDNIKNGI